MSAADTAHEQQSRSGRDADLGVTAFQKLTDLIPLSVMAARGGRSAIRRLWWKLFKIADPRAPFRVPVANARMWIDPADTIISYALAKHGVFEPDETLLMRRLLPRCRSFVDCGANIGYYSILAAKILSPPARVFAFEPAPRNFALLERNIAANELSRQIAAYRLGLGTAEGEAALYLETGNAGAHSLFAANVAGAKEHETIRLVRLDAAIGDAIVDVVKIDTQGAELDVLKGATAVLARDHPLLVLEWWPWGLRGESRAAALAAFLRGFGYAAGVIGANGAVECLDWDTLLNRADPGNKDETLMLVCFCLPAHRALLQG